MNLIGNNHIGTLIRQLNEASNIEVKIDKYMTSDNGSTLLLTYGDLKLMLVGETIDDKEYIRLVQKYVNNHHKNVAMLMEYNAENTSHYELDEVAFDSKLLIKRFVAEGEEMVYSFLLESSIKELGFGFNDEESEVLFEGSVAILNITSNLTAKIIFDFYNNPELNFVEDDTNNIIEEAIGKIFITSFEGDVVYQR